ncbi:uncharacterized protein LOC125443018 isoform X2 [Sphaerodactylus townsendi]|uniref:uncharacterized protein LOC125443018 isoform X2 n=1 Tax=Sphaerodactylus townsendi TaxID=933632 RepID=UPI002026440D|nr:uncharacterized protein LOC125443018 isoform X2 [Sphaerodactylus townsendi]
MLLYSGHEAFKSPRGECSVGLWIGCDLPQLFDVPILLCPQLTGIWFPAGASSSLSVITPQKLFRVYPGQTAFLRLSLQFRQPEWKYFHAKWRFLTKNVPVLYCAAECKAGSSSANHTCEYTVEKDGAYEARVDVQEGCSLVLMDVWPEDAGKYEVRVLALDESGSASLEVDVLEGNGRDLSSPGPRQPQGSANPVSRKGARGRSGFPITVEPTLSTKEGLPSSDLVSWPLRAISAAVHHTAWLPIQPLDHAWTFLIIKWEFVTTNRSRPILVYFVDSCNGTIGEWWERECTIHKTVAVEYQQRVNILRNGTLVIHSVDFKDAGVYQATIWTSSGKVQAAVNLTVIPGQKGTSRSLHLENVARIILAGILLCFLGLLVGEHVWTTICPGPPSQARKGDGALL